MSRATDKGSTRLYRSLLSADRCRGVRVECRSVRPCRRLAMEFLGFANPMARVNRLLLQSRRAMGFREWALITHPSAKDARLALVKTH